MRVSGAEKTRRRAENRVHICFPRSNSRAAEFLCRSGSALTRGRDVGTGGPLAPPSTSAPPAPSSPTRSGNHINTADTNTSPTGASVTRPVDLRGSPRSSPKPGPTSRVFRMGRPVPGGLRVRKRAGGRARPSGPVRAPLGAARADLGAPGMSAGSPSRAATTARCAPMGDVSTGMIVLYPGGIGGTRQQSNFPRARLRKVDRGSPSPPRLPRAGL